jgi:hypothetical protein
MQRQGSEALQAVHAPFCQSGRLIAVDQTYFVLDAGRTTLRFFVEDWAELLGGRESALRLLHNAAAHRDFVELRVLPKRLSYHNEAQYARIPKAS